MEMPLRGPLVPGNSPATIATGTAPAHGRGADDGPGSNRCQGPYFWNVSNIAQTPVPDCGWLQLSAPGPGTFYKHSIFEPGKPQCANACGFFSMAASSLAGITGRTAPNVSPPD
jgi:hypothetical protein